MGFDLIVYILVVGLGLRNYPAIDKLFVRMQGRISRGAWAKRSYPKLFVRMQAESAEELGPRETILHLTNYSSECKAESVEAGAWAKRNYPKLFVRMKGRISREAWAKRNYPAFDKLFVRMQGRISRGLS